MALMVKARDCGSPVYWLVRSRHNRTIEGVDKRWSSVSGGLALGALRFTMPSRQGRKARE